MANVLSGLISKMIPSKGSVHKVTACDIGRSKIILMELQKNEDHLFISRFEIIKNAFLDQKLSLILKPFFDGKKFQKEGIRVALKGHGVVTRFIRFPKMKVEDLGSALKYEAEQYIPFELNSVAMDFGVVEDSIKADDGEKMEVMLAVIKLSEFEPVLEIFRNLECHLSVVDVDILSSLAALEYFHPQDFSGHVALLDLGTEISTLGVVREGNPRFIRDISYGVCDLQKRLKTRANLTEEKIEQVLEKKQEPTAVEVDAIQESLDGLIGDLRVSFDYYRNQAPQAKPMEKLYLTGGAAANPVIIKTLSEGLKMPVLGMNVMEKLKWSSDVQEELLKTNAHFLSVVLGLGVREE